MTIQKPTRMTGNPAQDAANTIEWAWSLYSTLAGYNIEKRFEATDAVEPLNLTVSNPPTQAEMQLVVNKLNEILVAMKQPAPTQT